MRRRVLVALQAVVSIAAVVCAIGIVRSEVVDQTSALASPIDVAAGGAVDIRVTYSEAPEPLDGAFRVLEITDHPRLTPIEEYDDPVEREGGRVVVVGIECDCPVSDDLLVPSASVLDSRGREWEADLISQPNPEDYVELGGYSPSHRFGEETPYRYVAAFIVPADVAGDVRLVLQRDPGPAYRFAR